MKESAIPIFEEAHPGKTALFVFDQSSAHASMGDDALNVSRMNSEEGTTSKSWVPMKATYIPPDAPNVADRNRPQEMSFMRDGKLQPKGMRRVLRVSISAISYTDEQERGYEVASKLKICNKNRGGCPADGSECSMTAMLLRQQDFREQKSVLEQTITGAGHLCIFLPKYHCELNPIEMVSSFHFSASLCLLLRSVLGVL